MPERLPLTDTDLRHYMGLDGFTLERVARLYHVSPSKVEKHWARLEREQQQEEARKARQMQQAMTGRPMPPDWLCEDHTAEEADCPPFLPAHDLMDWARATFIDDDGLLCNPSHSHLALAQIGIVWTGVGLNKQMRPVAGQMCIPQAQGDAWARARHDFLMCHWFGAVPHFLMTLSGAFCAQAGDATFCALVEHELLHAAQAVDMFGCPKFYERGDREGEPVFAIKGHDISEFTDIVRRYGIAASSEGVGEFVKAANQPPLLTAQSINSACGTCL